MPDPNLPLLEDAVRKLAPFLDEIVFVGGVTLGLLITDKAAAPIRGTKDVDVIAEIVTYADYIAFSERLRKAGFQEDTGENPLTCRWHNDGLTLDVLALNEDVLGFTNIWYEPALKHAFTVTLSGGQSIRVPALMPFCLRGKLRPEAKNPAARASQALYLPVLRWCLRNWKIVVVLNLAFLAATVPLCFKLGSQFMPALYEGSALYMPSSLPGISITQAASLMQQQDRIIRSFPEVSTVFGTVGRSDSATDNAPLDMYDTTIMLKPREQWRTGMTYEKLIREMDEKLQFPGLTNTWTMPVQNRLDMELTGIKTAIGIKIQGPDLNRIQDLGAEMQQVLSTMPEATTVYAERVSQGFYLNVEVNRPAAARYGLTVADIQRVVSSELGGIDIAENIEGRERFPIAVRYLHDYRDTSNSLSEALIPTPSGAQIPVSEVARVYYSRGPAMIRDEDGSLTGYVYLNLKTSDYGGFVNRANALLNQKIALPAGYTWRWAGEYEFEVRAKQRLMIILPIVFFVIFLLLYLVFKSVEEAAVLIFPAFYAMSGGLLLQWLLRYNFSVAVWVGYIALFGIAVETGVVMVVYLHEALEERMNQGTPLTETDLVQATIAGAVQRLRPKLMTVTAVILSLAPILRESGIGSDVMKPIAAPIVGGMITSTIHVLILVPVFFLLMKRRDLRAGRLHPRSLQETEVQSVMT